MKLRVRELGALVLCISSGCGRVGITQLDLEPNDSLLGRDGNDNPEGSDNGRCADADADGVCDAEDNCSSVANPDQEDADENGVGDACEGTDAVLCADETDPCACLEAPTLSSKLAHWPFDDASGDQVSEVTGSAPAGTLVNFAQPAWEEGQLAGALRFDGVDDHVGVGDSGDVGALRTLSFWLKPDTRVVETTETPLAYPSSTGPRNDWSNPQNAYSEGGGSASANLIAGSKVQHWGGFHLADALPEGAVVQGISVGIGTSNFGLLGSFGVELSWDGGNSHTSANYSWGQLVIGASERVAGGPDLTWGRSWQASDLSDANFRVRATFGGVVNTMQLDYVWVRVHYAPYPWPRGVLQLSDQTSLGYTRDGERLALSGWPSAQVYVNGEADGALGEGFNHVVVTGPESALAENLEFGRTRSQSYPLHGVLDDVRAFEAELSPTQVSALYAEPSCE